MEGGVKLLVLLADFSELAGNRVELGCEAHNAGDGGT